MINMSFRQLKGAHFLCAGTSLGQPFAAQLADTTSRPTAYAISLTLYTLGFIVVASANGVSAIAAGESDQVCIFETH